MNEPIEELNWEEVCYTTFGRTDNYVNERTLRLKVDGGYLYRAVWVSSNGGVHSTEFTFVKGENSK